MTRFSLPFLLALVALFAVPLAAPGEAMLQPVYECPGNAVQYRNTRGGVTCRCSAGATRSGSVWGTDIYTDDSSICRAALHAGAVSSNGGNVRIILGGSQPSYAGSGRNGVQSRDYGRWDHSYRFLGAGGDMSDRPGWGGGGGRIDDCPRDATSLRGTGRSLECRCSASDTRSGTVWGSGTYTDDSSKCRAAVHAGEIGERGGVVTIWARPGQNAYRGSYRNSVETRDYGRWSGSFEFAGGGGGGYDPPPGGGVDECPFNATWLRNSNQSLRCRCPAGNVRSGNVWGTDVYSDDSDICRAAVHAGVIGERGGVITVLHRPGRRSYRGSRRNGVNSLDFGRWGGSFEVR